MSSLAFTVWDLKVFESSYKWFCFADSSSKSEFIIISQQVVSYDSYAEFTPTASWKNCTKYCHLWLWVKLVLPKYYHMCPTSTIM